MKKKIVIIGGGFAGSHVAKKLEKGRRFEVTLVDTKNYFEFTPGILRALVEPDHLRDIQVLHSHYLKWTEIIVGKVKKVGKNYVEVGRRKLDFDYLVVSSGSGYDAPIKEHDVVTALRADNLRRHYDDLFKAESVLIIGGGLVGVELAGEICWKYGDEKDITIVHSAGKLMARNNAKAVKYAEKYLEGRGVKIIFGEKVVRKKGKVCETDKGRKIEADMVFLCTGIVPNYKFMDKKYLDERKRIKVNEFLQLKGRKNVFVAGDVTDIKEEKTAQNSERQGEIIVRNIRSLEKGKKLEKYKSKRRPLVISLGGSSGIFEMGGFVFGGWIPSVLKGFIEWQEMWKKRA